MSSAARRWGIAIVAAVAASWGGWWFATRDLREFRAEVELLRSEGFAVTEAELRAEADLEADAAGAELRAAYQSLGEFGATGTLDDVAKVAGFPWVRGLTGPWDVNVATPWEVHAPPERIRALAEWLDAARPWYERFSAALAHDEVRIPLKSVPSIAAPTVDIASVQNIQRLLSARALAATRTTDRIAAIRDELRLAQRQRTLQLLDTSVARSGLSTATREIRFGVTSGDLPAAELLATAGAELRHARTVDVARIARGEIAWIAESAEWIRDGGTLPARGGRGAAGSLRRALRAARRIVEDEYPLADFTRSLRGWRAIARGERAWPRVGDPTGPDEAFDANTLAMLRRMDALWSRQDAATTLADVALAVKVVHEETGAWPASLDALAPRFGGAVPRDPYTGRPFAYEVTSSVVRISSQGCRDGGVSPSAAELDEACLVWEFAR